MIAISLAACSSGSKTASDQAAAEGNGPISINVSIASEPNSLDPALNSTSDGATVINHLFTGLVVLVKDASGSIVTAPGVITEITEGTKNDDGTITYTYHLKDGLTWSDGQPLTASDFVFAWNRAASPTVAGDYHYMFDVIKGYDAMWDSEPDPEDPENVIFKNPDAKLAVEATDDQTLVVTLNNEIPYWNELLAFPAYVPVREDIVSNESWATDPATYIGNGAYVMKDWQHNSVITLEKNPAYFDADSVTMDVINFYLSDNANNMLTNFKNGEWQMIDDVPTNEIASLKNDYPDEFSVEGQLGTYYAVWQINNDILPEDSTLTGVEAERAREEIRKAVSKLIDRNYIVSEITQAGQVPASSFVAMGLTDADGVSQFYQNAGHNADFDGYYNVSPDAVNSNYNEAIETLKKYYNYDEATNMFTNIPSMTYLYNTSEGHKAIGEYIQSTLATVGISLSLENQEWNTFLETRKQGNYSIARNGWLGDYNDPISFLDMWTTSSGNNDVQFGKEGNGELKAYSVDTTDLGLDLKVENGTWSETYDELIGIIKTTEDRNTRYALMHKAEDLLMSTGALTPLYYYTDLFMLNQNVKGFYSSPLGYKYFMYCTYAGN